MSILSLPRTYGNLKRLQQIVLTLVRHGFAHILSRLHLVEYVPGLSYLKLKIEEAAGGDADLATAERLARTFQDLGATFIKFGQILATRPDLMPPDFIRAFARLQDAVAPLPAAVIRQVIEQRLQASADQVFAAFDDRPVASGSIGQVHFATLHDGAKVVVKIKRSGTDERVREDLDLLAGLAALAEKHLPELAVLRPRVVVEEFARLMERELDFVGEASYTAKFARDLAGEPSVTAPRVFWEYVTRDTLVLERIEGVRLTDPATLPSAGIDPRALARTLGRCFMRQFFTTGFFHADPHPGNLFALGDGRVALVDFGQMGHIADDLRRQLALALIALAEGDTDCIVDIYAEIGAFTARTDLRQVKSEFRALLDRYYGVPLDRLDVASVFHEALGVARNNAILLPRDFVLLGKSFVTVMGVLRGLDPAFRVDEAVRPFAREAFSHFLRPSSLGKRMGFYLFRVHSLLRRIPEDIRDILEKVRGGELRIIFHHEALEESAAQFERTVNRLTLGIVIAAITIGSSIVLAAGDRALGSQALPLVGSIPLALLLSGLGFSLAIVMGFWVAWGILRGRKP